METNSALLYCLVIVGVLQGLLPLCCAMVTCDKTLIENPFGEISLILPSPTGSNVCEFTFQEREHKDNSMLVLRVLAVKYFKSATDVVKLSDGNSMLTTQRNWNDVTPEPECHGFVKDADSAKNCKQRFKTFCNDSQPKLAMDWPPKLSVYSQRGSFLFTYAVLECPKTFDPALVILGVLFSITLVLLVLVVYLILRKRYIKREKQDRSNIINVYAKPSYEPMPDAASRAGTLQLPTPNQQRSPSVQSQLSNVQVASLQSMQAPLEDPTTGPSVQRQLSEPKAVPVTPPAALAPLARASPAPVQLTASAPVSMGNNSSGVYENPTVSEVYEMPIRHDNVDYMDFNESTGQESTPDIYVQNVREAGI